MIPYILLVLMVIVYFFSFANIFEKNGRQKWEGYVPIYNIYVWLKILEKPWWWIFFFPIPFVNLIVAIGCNVETARLFGKYSVKDTFLMILLPWYYLPYLAFDSNNVVVAPTDWTKVEDRSQRKWHDQITLFFYWAYLKISPIKKQCLQTGPMLWGLQLLLHLLLDPYFLKLLQFQLDLWRKL